MLEIVKRPNVAPSMTDTPSTALAIPALPPLALAELRRALRTLHAEPGVALGDRSGIAARAANVLGAAAGMAGRAALGVFGGWGLRAAAALPGTPELLRAVAERALLAAYDAAILRLPPPGAPRTGPAAALGGVAASGAAGGALGLAGFAPDAAVFTLALMRRIARVAAEEGEDLSTDEARRACLQVFALRSGQDALAGGQADAGGDAGYFQTRLLLQGGTVARLVVEVAGRYGLQLGQKLAAGAVPVAGAVAGAAVNAAFMAQYDSLARAHFTVRRLERTYGAQAVAAAASAC